MSSVSAGHPVGGVDYPRTFQKLISWFPDDEACVAYLAGVRWRDGFVCPACSRARRQESSARWCRRCGRIMVSLLTWIWPLWLGEIRRGVVCC